MQQGEAALSIRKVKMLMKYGVSLTHSGGE